MASVDTLNIAAHIKKILSTGRTLLTTRNQFDAFDARYLDDKYWKLDNFGNLTNTWFRLYIGDGLLPEGGSIPDYLEELPIDGLGPSYPTDILVFGVSIEISRAPKLITTPIVGKETPVYQRFSNDSYDITITFNESGPFFWQQNSLLLTKLLAVLAAPQTIKVSNPQLKLIYGIDRAVVTDYRIGQDPRFYQKNRVQIKLRSDSDYDLIVATNKTI